VDAVLVRMGDKQTRQGGPRGLSSNGTILAHALAVAMADEAEPVGMLVEVAYEGEFERLVLAKAAQHNPLCVRTAIVAAPGRLPLCHQLLALLTAQPFA
jgi:hypothetical protein